MRVLTKTLLMVIISLTFAAVLPSMIAAAPAGGFSVAPMFPENQNPDNTGFFDVRVVAGERQPLYVSVSNPGSEPITVEMSLFAVGTNRNGVVDYTTPGRLDETMQHAFSDIAFMPYEHEITIPAGYSALVPIYADIPEEGFDGLILGAIRVLLGITDEQRAEAGMIVNRFAHVVIVRLQENDAPIEHNFALGEVGAETVNHRAAIVAEVRNPVPRMSLGADIDARIYPAGQNEPIWTMHGVRADFAPNSIYELTFLDDEGFGIHPGDYLLTLQLDHEGRTWNFERAFTISSQEATEINIAAVNQQPMETRASAPTDGMNPLVIIAIAAVLIALLIAVLLFIKSNKKNNEAKQELAQMREQLRQQTQQDDKSNHEN